MKRIIHLWAAIMAAALAATCGVSAWQYGEEPYCRNVTIQGANASLSDFPVLVILTDTSGMNETYSDLRFVDAACDSTGDVIRFELASSNATRAVTYLRLNVTTSAKTVSVYYGNMTLSDGSDKNAVWDSSKYLAVYHFNDGSGNTISDSAGTNQAAIFNFDGLYDSAWISAGTVLDGAYNFTGRNAYDGDDSYAVTDDNVHYSHNGTVSMWMRPGFAAGTKVESYMALFDLSPININAFDIENYADSNSYWQVQGGSHWASWYSSESFPSGNDGWFYAAVTWNDFSHRFNVIWNDTMKSSIYDESVGISPIQRGIPLACRLISSANSWNSQARVAFDEVRVYSYDMSEDWLLYDYDLSYDNPSSVSFSAQESQSSSPPVSCDSLNETSTNDIHGYFEMGDGESCDMTGGSIILNGGTQFNGNGSFLYKTASSESMFQIMGDDTAIYQVISENATSFVNFVEDCHNSSISDNDVSHPNIGILMNKNVSDIYIYSNTFDSVGLCVILGGGSVVPVKLENLSIHDNVMTDSDDGIRLSSLPGGYVRRALITRNNLTHIGNFSCLGDCDANPSVYGFVTANNLKGMTVDYCSEVNVSMNRVVDSTGYGIDFGLNCLGGMLMAQDNAFIDTAGIRARANATFHDNLIHGQSPAYLWSGGLYFWSASDGLAYSNILNHTQTGMYVRDSGHVKMHDNIIDGLYAPNMTLNGLPSPFIRLRGNSSDANLTQNVFLAPYDAQSRVATYVESTTSGNYVTEDIFHVLNLTMPNYRNVFSDNALLEGASLLYRPVFTAPAYNSTWLTNETLNVTFGDVSVTGADFKIYDSTDGSVFSLYADIPFSQRWYDVNLSGFGIGSDYLRLVANDTYGNSSSDDMLIDVQSPLSANQIPVIIDVSISPSSAYDDDDLQGIADISDAETDNVTISFWWYIDDILSWSGEVQTASNLSISVNTLSAGNTTIGDVVIFETMVSDDYGSSSRQNSSPVTILAAPVIPPVPETGLITGLLTDAGAGMGGFADGLMSGGNGLIRLLFTLAIFGGITAMLYVVGKIFIAYRQH